MNTAVDEKIKEADHFIDEKREDVVHKAQEAISGATAGSGVGAMLGKAKGLLGSSKYFHVHQFSLIKDSIIYYLTHSLTT